MKDIALRLPGNYIVPTPPGFKSSQMYDLGSLLSQALDVIFSLAFFLLFFWMAWGVFEYIFSAGEKEKLGKAQKRITWAIVGFLIVMFSFILKDFVQNIFPQQSVNVTTITVPK